MKNREDFQHLFNTDKAVLPILIATWDSDPHNAVIVYQNKSCSNKIGYYVNKSLLEFFNILNKGKGKSLINNLLTDGELSFSCNINNLDLLSYSFKGDSHIQVSITDITELNELRDVEQRSKLIETFLMIGSHELKTPLNGILGISSLLVTEETDKEKKELLEMIISAAQTLDSVVLKMLRQIYSYKIDDVITAVVDVNVGQVIKNSLPIFNNCLRDRNFVMDNVYLNDTLNVRLPEGHLDDILLEIAINLRRNTPPDGDVFIKTFDKDNMVHIVVENQGMGIPDKDIEKIFEPFYLHQESMNHSSGFEYGKSGIGIGLTILKRNVEQAGGKVWFENKYKYEKGKENCVILNIEFPVN